MRHLLPLCPIALLVAAGLSAPVFGQAPDAELQARAERIAQRILLVDSHIDFPEHALGGDDVMNSVSGNFDHPRAVKGGLKAAFMAVYVPPGDELRGTSVQTADTHIRLVESIVAAHPDLFALATTPADLDKNQHAGKISLAMGLENGAPLEGKLERIAGYHTRGIRYITLTHVKDNRICDSSFEGPDWRTWHGLSPFGKEVVREMNRVGMMIDVSHISDEALEQVLDLSKAPVIASHSGCRHFTPKWERNLSDAMIKTLAAKGGVVQIPFGSMFLSDRFLKTWRDEDRVDVKDVAAHIDYVVKLAGIDHVGIGSDFDGVGPTLPRGLEDVSKYPNLIRELLKLGYSETDIEKLSGRNLLRVWSEVEAVAKSLHS